MRKFGVKRGGKGEISSVKKGIKADISRVSPWPVRGLTFPSSELAYFNGTSAYKV